MKVFFRRIHLYMGLTAGIVIMITCLTGAILVFEKELQHLFYKDRYYTKVKGTRLAADSLIHTVSFANPDVKVGSIRIYNNPERTAEVVFSPVPDKKQGAAKKGKPESRRLVAFVDPYTGKIKDIYEHRKSFFYFVMDLHRWMLGGDTGKLLVGICTAIFLFIISTGIVLWWPRNRAILKQRLKIKSDAGYKRLNHDYHVVFGFYSGIFLFVFAFTGLAWSFEWFNKAIYTVTGTRMVKLETPKNQNHSDTLSSRVEDIFQAVIAKDNTSAYYNLTLPKNSLETFTVTTMPVDAIHESATDTYYVDAHTKAITKKIAFGDRNTGQKVRSAFKPVHVASIGGIPTKIIGLVVCLFGTFLPLTGIIMWINRTWRKKRVVQAF